MTIRAILNRQKRWTAAVHAAFVLLIPLLGLFPWLAPWALPGLVLAFATLGYAYTWGFRCPCCRGAWGDLVLRSDRSPFRIDSRLHYCPYCGSDIDTEVRAQQQMA